MSYSLFIFITKLDVHVCWCQVNDKDMHSCSHEEAAQALTGAGQTVNLLVEHRKSEFLDFQKRLQQLQETQATTTEPSSPGAKPPPVKQLYVR